jgi:acyl dehydratase
VQTLGLGIHFEDLAIGRQFRTIGRTINEIDIVNYCNCTGNTEVLFNNLEFLATESDLKGRPAPAALAYAIAEGLLVQATMQYTGFAFLGMELEVIRPVVANDTIHVEVEVIEARRSRSRPNRGLVKTRNQIINQRGEVVINYTPLRMVKCKRECE